jgi:hypothetical protein
VVGFKIDVLNKFTCLFYEGDLLATTETRKKKCEKLN